MSIPSPESLLTQLLSINSINPDLIPGAAGEAEIAQFIAGWLEQAGLEVHMHEVAPGRPNVVGIARGTGGGKTLMLNGHVDIVGIEGMENGLTPEIQDGRLYGRGAYDMKGGLAACMLAAAEAAKHPLSGDVILTAVMDEEYAGVGTLDIAQRYRADAAIVAEPTEMQLIVAHRGFVWLEVETQGVAAHGSRPDLGLDAVLKMGRVLTALEEQDRRLRANPTHPLLGSGSMHASFIRGGHELATYPYQCVLTLERRTLPGETPEKMEAELQNIVANIAAQDPDFHAVVRLGMHREPLETPADAEIIPVVKAAVEQVLERPAEVAGVGYWTDAASLWAVGIPSILLGPAGAGAHAVEEWVDLDSVRACAEIYLQTALNFCK